MGARGLNSRNSQALVLTAPSMTVEPAWHKHCPKLSEAHDEIECDSRFLKGQPAIRQLLAERARCMGPVRRRDIPAFARRVGQCLNQRWQDSLVDEFKMTVSE